MKTLILSAIYIYIFPNIALFMRCDKKIYCRSRLATEDNIMRLMRLACWTTKATETHPEYVILISFT